MVKRKLQHDGQFKPGNVPWNKGGTRKARVRPPTYIRPTEQDYRLLANRDRKGNVIHNRKDIIRELRRPILLRPQKSASSEMSKYLGDGSEEDEDDVVGYRIWKATAAVQACAKAQREHDERRPTCKELVRVSAKWERKVGLATWEKLVCDRCGYSSSRQKFYDEMKRDGPGERIAVINMAAQVALADTPMAVTAFRQMMASMDLPVPSEKTLQDMATRYSDIMEEENKRDMQRWIEVVKRVNTLKGNKPGAPIRGQADTRYHTPLGNLRGRKPGQPSDNSNATFVEEVTKMKKVLANHLKIKTCGMCKWWKSYRLKAPPHRCTANTCQEAPIGNEEGSGEKMARDLLNSNVRVSGLVTDGDSQTWRGMARVMREEAVRPIRVKHERCRVHISRNVRAKVSATKWSPTMFPGAKAENRNRVKHRFANDLAQRLNAEHEQALAQFGMRTRYKVERAMDKAMQAIPLCYAGDHTRCFQDSLVCRHPTKWTFDKIPAEARGQIRPNPTDCKVLRVIMEMRLGKTALERTRHGADTNKAESVNRQISKSQPKNITRFRTLAGRIASALHSSNNSTGLSVVMKRRAAGIPLSPKSRAVCELEKMTERQDYKRSYKMEPATKKREKANTMEKFDLYDECRERGTYKSAELAEFSKGTRKSPRKRARQDNPDHGYSRPGDAEPEDDYTDSDSDSDLEILT